MIYLLGSVFLSVLGTIGTWLGLRRYTLTAAWWLIATMPLSTAYDIITRQYGFIWSSAVILAVAIHTLRGERDGEE